MNQDQITVREAAKILGCGISNTHHHIAVGRMRVVDRIGNAYILDRAEVEQYAKERLGQYKLSSFRRKVREFIAPFGVRLILDECVAPLRQLGKERWNAVADAIAAAFDEEMNEMHASKPADWLSVQEVSRNGKE